MFVAIAKVTLSIPDSGSLKSKRHVVHKVLDKVKARFNVSIAEVEDNDLWQKATLGIAAVANEHAFAQECCDKVLRFIEELYVAPVIASTSEIIPCGGELFGDDGSSFGSSARGAHRTLAEAEEEAEADAEPGTEQVETWRETRTLAEAEQAAASPRPRGGRGGQVRQKRPLTEREREAAIEELRQRMRGARRGADDEGGEN